MSRFVCADCGHGHESHYKDADCFGSEVHRARKPSAWGESPRKCQCRFYREGLEEKRHELAEMEREVRACRCRSRAMLMDMLRDEIAKLETAPVSAPAEKRLDDAVEMFVSSYGPEVDHPWGSEEMKKALRALLEAEVAHWRAQPPEVERAALYAATYGAVFAQQWMEQRRAEGPGSEERYRDVFVKFAHDVAARAVESHGWIPVTERIPAEGARVTAYAAGKVTRDAWVGYGDPLDENAPKPWFVGDCYHLDGVTHWMVDPLPAPPKVTP